MNTPITLSLSNNGEAVDTAYLHFDPIEPFSLTGVYGGFIKEQDKVIAKPGF